MKKKFRLNRRTFLTGLGGTVVGLPLLEAMVDESSGSVFAQQASGEAPKRYIVTFGGHSLGGDGDQLHNMFAPDSTGADYDLKTALQPLGDQGVKDHVSVVSNLEIPSAEGGSAPAGGRHDDFHIASLSPLLSGVRSVSGGRPVRGITSDQVVAQQIGQDTTFESLVMRVQASWYLDQSAPYGRELISYRGENDPIEATVSPEQAFRNVFSSFEAPDPEAAARRDFLLRGRKSVLDLVRGSYEELQPKLGAADRQRLSDHLDRVRDLEKRVNATAPEEGGICQMLDDPGADPPIGGNNSVNGGEGFDVNAGYSDEDTRAEILSDIIHMAMACDMTRVASLQYTMAQSHMNMYPLVQIPYDLHEIGHSSGRGTAGVSDAIAWHVKHFAYLVKKLADTPEGSGTMLDNTVVLYLSEGGHGWDPGGGKDNSSHSTERMAMLVAGGAGGGLNPGRHIRTNGAHPGQAIISAMNAVGVDTDTFGEVQGNLPELFA